VQSSAIGSVLESVLGSVIESVLRVDFVAYSQAGWECTVECNQVCTSERIWERAKKCIWQFGFKFVECSMMYSIKRT